MDEIVGVVAKLWKNILFAPVIVTGQHVKIWLDANPSSYCI